MLPPPPAPSSLKDDDGPRTLGVRGDRGEFSGDSDDSGRSRSPADELEEKELRSARSAKGARERPPAALVLLRGDGAGEEPVERGDGAPSNT
jgi:hypothetical protein